MKIQQEVVGAQEYIDFLKRSDLGSQYPKERFNERIEKLVMNVSISLTMRDEKHTLIGICFGLTDFAYWLLITDLAIDRNYVHLGYGKTLFNRMIQEAGTTKDLIVYTCANEQAIGFYEKMGMSQSVDVMELNQIEFTHFVVR